MIQEKDITQIVKAISLLKEMSDGEKFTSFFTYKKKDGVYSVDFFNYGQTLTRISIKEGSIEDALESLKGGIRQSVFDLGIEKNSGYTDKEKKILGRILDKVRKLDSCDKVENLTFSFGTEKEESSFRISWDYRKDGCTRYCCINGDTPQGMFEELETTYKTFPVEKKKDLLTRENIPAFIELFDTLSMLKMKTSCSPEEFAVKFCYRDGESWFDILGEIDSIYPEELNSFIDYVRISKGYSDLRFWGSKRLTDQEKQDATKFLERLIELKKNKDVRSIVFKWVNVEHYPIGLLKIHYCDNGLIRQYWNSHRSFEGAKDSVSEFIADRERQKKRWTKAKIVLLGGQGDNRNKSYSLEYSIGEFEQLLNFKEDGLTIQLENEEKIFLNLSSVKWIHKEDDTFYFYY